MAVKEKIKFDSDVLGYFKDFPFMIGRLKKPGLNA